MATVFQKDPASLDTFTIDWTPELAGEVIVTSSFATPAGLTELSESNTNTTTTVELSGGTANTTYQLTNTISTATRSSIVQSFFVLVKEQFVGQIVKPALTLDEAKIHLRVIDNANDEYIRGLIDAATTLVEQKSRRRLVTRTETLILPGMPPVGDCLRLRWQPVQAVASIQYYDTANVLTTLDPSLYLVVHRDGATNVFEAPNQTWPATYKRPDAVTLTYLAGSGDFSSDVPALAKQAIRFIVAHWFEQPSPVASAAQHELPLGIRECIAGIRKGYYVGV